MSDIIKGCNNCKHTDKYETEESCKSCKRTHIDYDHSQYPDNWEPQESAHIADTGDRREFPSGAVRDMAEEKGRCDLMPLDVVAEIMHDSIISAIDKFVKTGDVKFLYNAIQEFSEKICMDMETLMLELAQHFEEGAKKYGENNWQKGLPAHSYIDSAVRHYLKFLRGDTDERHDRAFVWNLVCCIWTCIHKPEMDDYRKEEAEK